MHILKTNKKNIMFLTFRLRNSLLHSTNPIALCLSWFASPSVSHRGNVVPELTLLITVFLFLFCLPFCVCHFASHFVLTGDILCAWFCNFFSLSPYLYWKFIQLIEATPFSFLLPILFDDMTTSQWSYPLCGQIFELFASCVSKFL